MLNVKSPSSARFPFGGGSRLIVIDADDVFFKSLARTFNVNSWQIIRVDNEPPEELLGALADAFIIDVCPGGVPRTELVKRIRLAGVSCKIIAVTAYPSLQLAVAATKAGADNCYSKPVDAMELMTAIQGTASAPCGEMRLPSLARIEWDYIARVLASVDGNITKAARTLNIQRSTLQRKFKKYPPSW